MEFSINLPEFSHIKIQNSGEAVQQFMKMTDLPAQNQRVRFSLIYLPQTQPKVQRECTLVVFLAGVNQIWCTSFLYDINRSSSNRSLLLLYQIFSYLDG